MTDLRTSLSRLGVFALLLVVSACAYVTAFYLRFAGALPLQALDVLAKTIAVVLAVKAGVIATYRIHQGWSRLVNFHDLTQIAKSATVASIGVTLVDALAMSAVTIPRSVILLDWGAALLLTSACRCFPRAVRDWSWSRPRPDSVRVLIVGVDSSGETLLRELKNNPRLKYEPVGFVDSDGRYAGQRMLGLPVLGLLEDAVDVVRDYAVDEVLITAGDLPGRQVRELIQQASAEGFRVNVLPSYEQLLNQKVSVQPRPVAIADVLRRPSINLNVDEIGMWLRGRALLVTGSAGSIGSEICRQLLRASPTKLLLLDRSENSLFFLERELRDLDPSACVETVIGDINDGDRMRRLFREYRPEVVFHAAAYKHVPLMEMHPGEAVKNIVLATRRLADLADQFGADAFVMISTDKAVNPTSVMGSCKRLAEHYVQAKSESSSCRFVTVRFGNVLDSAGSVVPIFREQIARGGPVTVTHPDMVRFFMLIPEAAQLVIQAGAMGQGGEIFVLDMGEPVRIMDLAKDMIQLSGLRVGEDVEIQVAGLRPGEKLYEELHAIDESRQPTAHPKITVASGRPRKLLHVIRDIDRLTDSLELSNEQVKATLAAIIPLHGTSRDGVFHRDAA